MNLAADLLLLEEMKNRPLPLRVLLEMEPDPVLREFDPILHYCPDNPAAWAWLADTVEHLRGSGVARRILARQLWRFPCDPGIQNRLAAYAAAAGDHTEAKERQSVVRSMIPEREKELA